MDAIDRAHVDARRILRADARFADDVGHSRLLRRRWSRTPEPESIHPAARRLAAALLLAAVSLAAASAGRAAEAPPAGAASRQDARNPRALLPDGWTEAPAYLDLFAPQARREAYRAFVSRAGLEEALRDLASRPALLRAPGAWERLDQPPADAFGQSGRYDRWALARLYRGRAVGVARGPLTDQGRVIQSWTLVSPYPAPALDRLESGTLLLVVEVPPL
jgi:hypothetical protein